MLKNKSPQVLFTQNVTCRSDISTWTYHSTDVNVVMTGCTISGTTLTVGAVTSGTIKAGQTLISQNSLYPINSGTYIVSGSGLTWTISQSHNLATPFNINVYASNVTVIATANSPAVGELVSLKPNGVGFKEQICEVISVSTNVAFTVQVVGATAVTVGGTFNGGTFGTSTASSIASGGITGLSTGTLTVGGTLTGTFLVGQNIYGAGVPYDTIITELGTGSGGAGTYGVNTSTVVASTAITAGCQQTLFRWTMPKGTMGQNDTIEFRGKLSSTASAQNKKVFCKLDGSTWSLTGWTNAAVIFGTFIQWFSNRNSYSKQLGMFNDSVVSGISTLQLGTAPISLTKNTIDNDLVLSLAIDKQAPAEAENLIQLQVILYPG